MFQCPPRGASTKHGMNKVSRRVQPDLSNTASLSVLQEADSRQDLDVGTGELGRADSTVTASAHVMTMISSTCGRASALGRQQPQFQLEGSRSKHARRPSPLRYKVMSAFTASAFTASNTDTPMQCQPAMAVCGAVL